MIKLTLEINLFNPMKKRPSKQSLIPNIVVFLGLATAIINLVNSLI